MEVESIHASKKRILLSVYLDYLFFAVLWELLVYFTWPDRNLPFWAEFLTFGILEAVVYVRWGSFGMHILSIDRATRQVDPLIYRHETWLTMLLGVLLFLEGTKQLVRWTQYVVAQPAFGFMLDLPTQVAVNVVTGAVSVCAGYLFLKLHRSGFWIALAVGIVAIISYVLSWPLWDQAVAQLATVRRQHQGLPVRQDEIEFMQAIVPEALIALMGLALVAVSFTYGRFRSAARMRSG